MSKNHRFSYTSKDGKEKGPFTILEKFVNDRLDVYQEPERKGTPRGEKVGFPFRKYFASMVVGLTKSKLKDIANDLQVSYGLLRKWQTEKDFKAACKKHSSEFVAEIVRYLKSELGREYDELEDYMDGKSNHESTNYDANYAWYHVSRFSEEVLGELRSRADDLFGKWASFTQMDGSGSAMTSLKDFWITRRLYKEIISYVDRTRGEKPGFPSGLPIAQRLVSDSVILLKEKTALSELDQRRLLETFKAIGNFFSMLEVFSESEVFSKSKGEGA